jgi:hypothetical protein
MKYLCIIMKNLYYGILFDNKKIKIKYWYMLQHGWTLKKVTKDSILWFWFWFWVSIKGPYVESLVPSLVLLGVGEFLKIWGIQVIRSMILKGVVGPQPLPFPLFYLLATRGAALLCHAACIIMCCFITGPKVKGSTNHRPTPPKLWAKINLFSL